MPEAPPFSSFVILAGMRTGSNFLESNLNAVPGIACHGEAFNPGFIGYPNTSTLLGMTLAQRDAAPQKLIRRMRKEPGVLPGFRYFHDHDPRVLPGLLSDPACAKIILTRNPLDSYVSLKIARATGQWKLTNVTKRKGSTVDFDAAEFSAHLKAGQAFLEAIRRGLQISGQTAFALDYDDLHDLEVLNGLLAWLGVAGRLDGLRATLKRQNPEPVADKVSNPEEMRNALASEDLFGLARLPGSEPRRGPAVPAYVGGAATPLLFMPVPGGPDADLRAWLAALDGVTEAALTTGFSQRSLRDWMAARPGHRSFTVLRHPLARAHDVFCRRVLPGGDGTMQKARRMMMRTHAVPLPEGPAHSLAQHRAAFLGFLGFVADTLAGQTALATPAPWATQAQCVQGFAEFAAPDLILREEELAQALPALAVRFGRACPPPPQVSAPEAQYPLAAIHDAEMEKAARAAYHRDYALFGFADWGQAA
ncbi:MAG: nodulation protein NodH [Roseivivax sp.]|nr:nodulation protein NodH [Roseivivax sp.]